MAKYELSLQEYVQIFKRRKGIAILTFSSVILATVVFTQIQTPLYRAASSVEIEVAIPQAGKIPGWYAYIPGKVVATETEVITGDAILEEVARREGLIAPETLEEEIKKVLTTMRNKMIVTRQLRNTNIIEIQAHYSDAKKTAQIANTLAVVYKEQDIEKKSAYTRENRIFIGSQLEGVKLELKEAEERLREFKEKGEITGIAESLKSKMMDLKVQLATLLKTYTSKHPKVIDTKEAIQSLKDALEILPGEEVEYTRLAREVAVNHELYTLLNTKYKEAFIAEASRVSRVRIINYAVEPEKPIRPSKPLNYSIGSILGLMLGFLFTFVSESLSTTVKNIKEIEDYLKIPVLGDLPWVRPKGEKKRRLSDKERIAQLQSLLVVYHKSDSDIVEANRTLAANIEFLMLGKEKNALVFISTIPEEGKSVTVANYALTLAQMGKKVLLVESVFHRPTIHKLFGVKREPGWSDCIIGKVAWRDALRTLQDILLGSWNKEGLNTVGLENLNLLTAGYLPPNPMALISSPELSRLIGEWKENYDVVLFDTSPLLSVSNGLILSSKVDGVILVCQVGKAPHGALYTAKNQLLRAKANVLGLVLTYRKTSEMIKMGDYGYRYYGYRYRYQYKEKE